MTGKGKLENVNLVSCYLEYSLQVSEYVALNDLITNCRLGKTKIHLIKITHLNNTMLSPGCKVDSFFFQIAIDIFSFSPQVQFDSARQTRPTCNEHSQPRSPCRNKKHTVQSSQPKRESPYVQPLWRYTLLM